MELEFITAGTAVNTHGIRGEVKILPQGVEPELLAACGTLYLGGKPFALAAGRIHKGCLLAKLKGVEDMDAALALKGKSVSIRRADVSLPEGAGYRSVNCPTMRSRATRPFSTEGAGSRRMNWATLYFATTSPRRRVPWMQSASLSI